MVSSGDDASDLEGVSFTHEAISTSAVMPLAGMREEVSHCVSSDLEAWWSLTRECDRLTHMLVISSSVRMLNGTHRTTSDLRPATSFHLVLVKITTSLQDWLVRVIQTRSDRLRARAPPEQLSSSRSSTCRSSWNVLRHGCSCFQYSNEVCGMGCICDDSGALMLSTKLSPQPSNSVSYLSACWSSP